MFLYRQINGFKYHLLNTQCNPLEDDNPSFGVV